MCFEDTSQECCLDCLNLVLPQAVSERWYAQLNPARLNKQSHFPEDKSEFTHCTCCHL